MTITFEEIEAQLLANPKVKAAYDALAAEFEKSAQSEHCKKKPPTKKSSSRQSRRV